MLNNKITALVPMKGHSERVPGKNMRQIAGKPLFYWIIHALEAVPEIGEIVVNTDSDEIARTIEKFFTKVNIHKRDANLCGDDVPMNEIIASDVNYRSASKFFLQTHSTNPLISSNTIRGAINEFTQKYRAAKADSLFSVTRHQSRFFDEKMNAINHDPKKLIKTQDLAPLFEENSCIYVFSRESFLISGNRRIGKSPTLFEIPKLESVDIDYEDDFVIAAAFLEIRERHRSNA